MSGEAIPVTRITPVELRALQEARPAGLYVIDTRSREEHERGHLPGALHFPVHELARREKELPPRTSTVVVVGGPGARGRAGAVFLVLAGFADVLLLEGE